MPGKLRESAVNIDSIQQTSNSITNARNSVVNMSPKLLNDSIENCDSSRNSPGLKKASLVDIIFQSNDVSPSSPDHQGARNL